MENQRSLVWLPHERLVIGTDNGQLLFFERGVGPNPQDSFVFRCVLSHSPEDGNPITKMVPFKRGFVCGCEGGVLYIFDKSEEKLEYYKRP